MTLQRLLSYTRRAVDIYHLIDEGDKIAIGISGGKDSLTLLYAMHGLRRFYPKHFDIVAITVDLGLPDFDTSQIADLCAKLDVPYHVVKTDIFQIIFDQRKETNPCSLCAKMRKGALNDEIKRLGCNKVAYAHHVDDIIETFLMSLIFEGRINTFAPNTYLDRMDLHVIRPLIYVEEREIIAFKKKYDLPVVKAKCPADGFTKRETMKQMVKSLEAENPRIRSCLFSAIEHGNLKGWERDPDYKGRL